MAAQDDPAAEAYHAQLQALARHSDSLAEGRDRRHAAISRERDEKTSSLAEHDSQLAQLYFALYAGVMALRGTEAARPLEQRYYRLDELQARLSATWDKVV